MKNILCAIKGHTMLIKLKAVLKWDFPLSPFEKRLSVLRNTFLTKMLEIYWNYYSKYEESNTDFHISLNVLQ